MAKSRKNYKTQYNYTQTQNLIRIGCTTTEIAKFLKLTYNQAWNLRSDLLNKNLFEDKKPKVMSNVSNVTQKVNRRVTTKRKMSSNKEDVKVKKTKTGFKITVTLAI